MRERIAYVVSWATGPHRDETRTFPDWDPALEFYKEVASAPRTVKASLMEVIEREVRSFEREPGGAPDQGNADQCARV